MAPVHARPDPSNWRVQPIWDIYYDAAPANARPSRFPPLVTRDPQRQRGHPGGHRRHRLAGRHGRASRRLADRASRGLGADGELRRARWSCNWKIELEPGESVTGPLTKFEDTVYFGVFRVPPTSANYCAFGSSTMYGVHFNEPESAATYTPKPMLPSARTASVRARGQTAEHRQHPDQRRRRGEGAHLQGRAPPPSIPAASPIVGAGVRFTPAAGGATGGGGYSAARCCWARPVRAATSEMPLAKAFRRIELSKRAKKVGWSGSVD